jgi:2-keto-3-deoxy-L-rhamnonate aldolase RhmA
VHQSPNQLKDRLRAGEHVVGTFLNLGSPLSTEICSTAGLDWLLLDLEHGAGDEAQLLAHLQGAGNGDASLVVRVEQNERARFARALDLGAAGVMVPRVDTSEQAALAVSYVRYPPVGTRGVAVMTRAARFGTEGYEPIHRAADRLVVVIQIESERAVENADAIAAVDGVDVLFVGPSDLTFSMGIPGKTSDARYQDALATVSSAALDHGKAAGILLRNAQDVDRHVGLGFTFIGLSSDSGLLAASVHELVAGFRQAIATREAATAGA